MAESSSGEQQPHITVLLNLPAASSTSSNVSYTFICTKHRGLQLTNIPVKYKVQLKKIEINEPDQWIYGASHRDSAAVRMHVGTLKQTTSTEFNR